MEPQPISLDQPISTETQYGLLMGMECFPGLETYVPVYFAKVAAENPDDVDGIKSFIDCYVEGWSADRCISRISSEEINLSDEFKKMCRITVHAGVASATSQLLEPNSANQLNVYWTLLYEHIFATKEYTSNLEPEERNALNSLMSYFSTFFPSFYDSTKKNLHADSPLAKNLIPHESREVDPVPLDPYLCSNADGWERHDMNVEGLSYLVPVFTPKGLSHPWFLYESIVQSGLEIYKLFLAPEVFDQLLHPADGRPDLAFYVRNNISGVNELSKQCNFKTHENVGGETKSDERAIVLQFWDNQPSLIITDNPELSARLFHLTKTYTYSFIHEFAHVIHFTSLQGTEYQQGLEKLFLWSVRQDLKEHLLPFPPTPARIMTPYLEDVYSIVGPTEFFAEMVSEYIYYKLLFPEEKIQELPEEVRGRMRIMDDFFAGGQINPEAFAEDNMKEAFASAGIDYDLPAWAFDQKAELFFNSKLEMGGSIYAGAKTTGAPFSFGIGALLSYQTPLEYDPAFSVQAEGSFQIMSVSRTKAATMSLEFLGRVGMNVNNGDVAPIFGVGARASFYGPTKLLAGPHFSLGVYQEFDILNKSYPTYGMVGFGYNY